MRVIWRIEAGRPLSELVKSLAAFAEKHPGAQVSAVVPPDPEDSFAVEFRLLVKEPGQ
jgi:hypothetical protein